MFKERELWIRWKEYLAEKLETPCGQYWGEKLAQESSQSLLYKYVCKLRFVLTKIQG